MRHKYPRAEPEPVKSEPEPHPHAAIVAASGLLIFAAIFFPYIIGKYRLSEESLTWPVVEGKIESFRMEMQSGRSGRRYSIHAIYSYTVEEKNYTGERWTIGPDAIVENEFNFVSAKYHAGSSCDVHYRPSDPNCAVLRPGRYMSLAGIIVMGIMTISALALMIAKAITDMHWLAELRRSTQLFEEFKVEAKLDR